MTFSLKKLILALVAGAVVAIGLVGPANATSSVSFVTNPIPTFYESSATPSFDLTIDNGQAFPANSASVSVSGWTQLQNCPTSFVSVPSAACGVANVVGSGGGTITNPQVKYMGGQYVFSWTPSGTPTAITVSFDSGAWTTGTAGTSTMVAVGNAGPAMLNITVLSGSAPTPPTPSNNSSNSSSSDTLANTGINTATGIALLVGGASLALVGAGLILIARRKRSN